MIAGFLVHLFVFVGVGGLLVGTWVLTSGSVAELRVLIESPDTVDASFWPIWPLLAWSAALLIHLGATLVFGVFRAGRRGRSSGPPAITPTPESPRSGRRWVTVMFTDIVRSTQLNEALGDEAWASVLKEHRDLVRRAFLDQGGQEVNTQGDGFLARFETPTSAVLCAVDIQRQLDVARGEGATVPQLRIGVHAGEAVEDDGDLIGRVVNLASRVAGEAQPGEILVTEPVADYLGTELSLEDRGVRALKGISQPRHLLSVVWVGADAAAD